MKILEKLIPKLMYGTLFMFYSCYFSKKNVEVRMNAFFSIEKFMLKENWAFFLRKNDLANSCIFTSMLGINNNPDKQMKLN